MTKRSKILLVILVVIILFLLISLVSPSESKSNNLEEFESEITNPNNTLDPLEENHGSLTFVIDLALKVEDVINKVFSFIIRVVNGLTEKILLYIF